MNIRFYIDPETGLPHIYNHDVDEEEVKEVLDSPGEDRPGRDGSRVAKGKKADETDSLPHRMERRESPQATVAL
jgi:hypothetical protein